MEARYHDASDQLRRQHEEVERLRGELQDYQDGMAPSDSQGQPTKDWEQEEDELAENEARLTAALVNGGDEGENGISEEELKAIMSAMRAQAHTGSAQERESSVKAQKKLLLAVEGSRTKNQGA